MRSKKLLPSVTAAVAELTSAAGKSAISAAHDSNAALAGMLLRREDGDGKGCDGELSIKNGALLQGRLSCGAVSPQVVSGHGSAATEHGAVVGRGLGKMLAAAGGGTLGIRHLIFI